MIHESAIADEIDDLQRELETLAKSEKWSELALLLKRRDKLLSKVPDFDRATTISAAIQSTDRWLNLVQVKKQAVAHQLTSLRRGRTATGCYEAHRETEKAQSGF